MTTKTTQISKTYKSSDTEEFIDIHFYRPIGYLWAKLFERLHFTPNAVTCISMVIGGFCGVLLYPTNLMINLCGMLLLMWANMLDSADGQLARMTGKFSQLGRILDGFSGDIWFFSIYISIALRLFNNGEWDFSIFLLMCIAGLFHIRQASAADRFRNIHLYFLAPEKKSDLQNSETLKAYYHTLSFRKEFITKVANMFYLNYTKTQEISTPQSTKMLALIQTRYNGIPPMWMQKQYREASLPLLKYTNMLTFNVRSLSLLFCIIINEPWLYYVIDITIFNAMMVYMIFKYEKEAQLLVHKMEGMS